MSGLRHKPLAFAILLLAGCLECLQAQTGAAARVMEMSGQVSVLRGNSTWALNVGSEIQPQQVVVTGPDGSATFRVADGSTVEVFPNTRYIFRNSPGNWRDLLEVIIGRVRVQIEHMGGQPNPNQVRTETAVISVRGTVFDVAVTDQDGTTLVLVEEGHVVVQHLLQAGKARDLYQGDWVEVFPNQPLARFTDHGAMWQKVYRGASDALYQILMRTRSGGTTASTGGAGNGGGSTPLPSDCKTCGGGGTTPTPTPTPPPAPTPPPPAPPPPPPSH